MPLLRLGVGVPFPGRQDRDHLRYILPVKPEEFWQELEEGGGEPWQN